MHTLLLLALLGCGSATPSADPAPTPSPAPPAPVAEVEVRVAKANVDTVRAMIEKASGHVRVFNFWATWCQPCIAELPHLVKLQKEYPDVEVVLISLDHPSIGTGPVTGFLKAQQLPLQSFMLDADDPAMAMVEVYPDFPAAIPVTLVIDADGDLSMAYHRGVTYADLTTAVNDAQ